MTPTKSGWGGAREGAGRPPKPPAKLYRQISLKLPPDQLDWLAANVDNRNGFIVEAIAEKIERMNK